ncbi:hypothetical protein AX774_g6352 [Zancudomyces culisetae]|uniref:Uncharacterized protein n=1 Tax=Zancudomyces culisetae TaxID=1213189 RepID=A0A1R1PGW9_ZANCU|nr:hypothetical protein AX774_g6352 [Zancudomyces culisetae]|eukprot:OMH80220.1 hypothetical protein AX774_g6352 [Zancudomyces culisetae]
MINPVPNIVINSAITEKDMDPWFTIGPPPSAGSGCCLLANPILSLRVLSLMYYMDYPSTPIDFGEKDNFMNLLYSFNVTLDFLHQTSMANLSDKTYHQYESFKSSDLSAAKNKSTISGNGHAVNICKILEHHSWSTQNARTFVNSLLRLLFPEHEAVGYADDYSFD